MNISGEDSWLPWARRLMPTEAAARVDQAAGLKVTHKYGMVPLHENNDGIA
jgi:hypothetical protein